jgi:hypothetical protein
MRKPLPIGIDDFKTVKEHYFFVDKSLFIKDILEARGAVTLILRPRRFGKTINISMLKYFFEDISLLDSFNEGQQKSCVQSNRYLFEDLLIAQYPDTMKHQGKYPIILLSLKGIEQQTWQEAKKTLYGRLQWEAARHDYLITSSSLNQREQLLVQRLADGIASDDEYEQMLLHLSRLLTKHHGVKTIILIDEYDAPIHHAYLRGYYNDIVMFMKNFFGAGLKSNECLEFGVLTGVLRVAKESLFSGLNNLKVVSFAQNAHSSMFGFTQEDVDVLLNLYELSDKKNIVRSWYNGYRFGNSYVYNPWSILQFLDNKVVQAYWINMGNHELLQKLFAQHGVSFQAKFEELLQNKSEVVVSTMNTAITFSQLETNDQSIWLLLLFSGYMTIDRWDETQEEQVDCYIRIPNKEVQRCLTDIIKNWFKEVFGQYSYPLVFESLVVGDLVTFSNHFKKIIVERLSNFDIGHDEPEKTYHMFMLGFLSVYSNKYEILSNRESGYGRYDIAMIPLLPSMSGIVFEFKAIDKKEFEDGGEALLKKTAETALRQISNKAYMANIKTRSTTITKIGIAFAGKHVAVEYKQE